MSNATAILLPGRRMHESGLAAGDGSMLAVMGAGDSEQASGIAEAHDLTVANDNSPMQVVLSGAASELPAAAEHARELGAERFVDVGPGRVLTGLAKRTLPGVELVNA